MYSLLCFVKKGKERTKRNERKHIDFCNKNSIYVHFFTFSIFYTFFMFEFYIHLLLWCFDTFSTITTIKCWSGCKKTKQKIYIHLSKSDSKKFAIIFSAPFRLIYFSITRPPAKFIPVYFSWKQIVIYRYRIVPRSTMVQHYTTYSIFFSV